MLILMGKTFRQDCIETISIGLIYWPRAHIWVLKLNFSRKKILGLISINGSIMGKGKCCRTKRTKKISWFWFHVYLINFMSIVCLFFYWKKKKNFERKKNCDVPVIVNNPTLSSWPHIYCSYKRSSPAFGEGLGQILMK